MQKIEIADIADDAADDGSYWVTLRSGDQTFRLDLTESQCVGLVRHFQRGFVERATQMTEAVPYPQLKVGYVALGHGQEGRTALVVDTEQTGSFALLLDDATLANLRTLITNAIDANAARKAVN